MKKNKIALQIFVFVFIVSSFIACDKDFTTLESDILNSDVATNFDVNSESWNVITYTKPLGPVQVNNALSTNSLGSYNDGYGKTTSNFLTQLTLSTVDPDFGEEAEIDSVILNIPFHSSVDEIDEDENITYEVDSVIGNEDLRLRIFESDYFIRDFDPSGDLGDEQLYFSNTSASETEPISEGFLESRELIVLQSEGTSYNEDGTIDISESGFVLTRLNDEGETEVSQRQPPGIRLKLDPEFWQEKVINVAGTSVLNSQNNFSEYFRGLYFKVESINNSNNYIIFDAAQLATNITIFYSRLTPSTADDPEEREQTSFSLRFGPNRLNFFSNEFTDPTPLGDPESGSERIYIKGGEGFIGRIKLFNGDDLDNDDDSTFDDWKDQFVEIDDDGNIRSRRLVNEANLVIYVDQNAIAGGEPERIFLYDVDNKRPLVDYFLDGVNNSLPSFSIINHLQPLEREVDDDPNSNGVKYKLRITEHINNLLLRDSTNVELGLSVSLNVNLEEVISQRQVLSSEDSDLTVPIGSVISPRGTVLHGNNTEDESKKLYLEIFYTCLEEDDCDNQPN